MSVLGTPDWSRLKEAAMTSTQDKTVIAVTPDIEETLKRVEDCGSFGDRMDVAKLAMSVAIRKNLALARSSGRNTRWNVGGFDKDGAIAITLRLLFPSEAQPYRLAEDLIEAGAKYLNELLQVDGQFHLLTFLKDMCPEEDRTTEADKTATG